MKTFKFIILIGLLNVIHGAVHILQFIQSVLLTYYSISHQKGGWIEKVMESPWMGLIWGLLGILTIYIGYQDYKHHKTENHEKRREGT